MLTKEGRKQSSTNSSTNINYEVLDISIFVWLESPNTVFFRSSRFSFALNFFFHAQKSEILSYLRQQLWDFDGRKNADFRFVLRDTIADNDSPVKEKITELIRFYVILSTVFGYLFIFIQCKSHLHFIWESSFWRISFRLVLLLSLTGLGDVSETLVTTCLFVVCRLPPLKSALVPSRYQFSSVNTIKILIRFCDEL